nr:reverse transcriptase domain, reverse transcriptase zinc-binding domain protein [Tanacetum cinerariifolium]
MEFVVRCHGVGGNFYFLGLLSESLFGRVLVMETWLLCGSTSDDGLWKWPNDWLVKYPILNSIPVPIISDEKLDYLEWRNIDGIGKQFLVHNVWESIRPRDNLVS